MAVKLIEAKFATKIFCFWDVPAGFMVSAAETVLRLYVNLCQKCKKEDRVPEVPVRWKCPNIASISSPSENNGISYIFKFCEEKKQSELNQI